LEKAKGIIMTPSPFRKWKLTMLKMYGGMDQLISKAPSVREEYAAATA
jgi:hypothetical protein